MGAEYFFLPMNTANDIPADQRFITYVLTSIVDHPEDVVVERIVDELGTLLQVRVHPDDTGKVIGKGGQTIKSLRILLRIVGAKDSGSRVNLKLLDEHSLIS